MLNESISYAVTLLTVTVISCPSIWTKKKMLSCGSRTHLITFPICIDPTEKCVLVNHTGQGYDSWQVNRWFVTSRDPTTYHWLNDTWNIAAAATQSDFAPFLSVRTRKNAEVLSPRSRAIPQNAPLGGLSWRQIQPIVETLSRLVISTVVRRNRIVNYTYIVISVLAAGLHESISSKENTIPKSYWWWVWWTWIFNYYRTRSERLVSLALCARALSSYSKILQWMFFFLLSNYEECNIVLVSVFQTYLCVTILGLQLIHFTFLFFTANRMHMQQAS